MLVRAPSRRRGAFVRPEVLSCLRCILPSTSALEHLYHQGSINGVHSGQVSRLNFSNAEKPIFTMADKKEEADLNLAFEAELEATGRELDKV